MPFKPSRRAAGISAENAAKKLHISNRSLFRIETGDQPASPELVWDMAKLYQAPNLVRWQQSQVDPIGRLINPPILNGIINSPQAVHIKLTEVLEEASLTAVKLCLLTVNKLSSSDYSDHERRQYFELYQKCVSNVKQVIAEAEGVTDENVRGGSHRENRTGTSK